ncbi:MAG: RNB domain-containing ribonuclease, partial [Desulfatiglandales bacterium]
MIGRIIEFIEDGKLFCAICLEEKSGRLHLLTSRNREINLSHRRVLHASSRSYSVDMGKEGLLSLLKEAEELRERLKSGIDVKELWETVNDQDEIGFKDLAELVFGYNIGDEHISAVVRALFEDRVYFRLRENAFSPLPPQKVEEYFERLEEERRKKERVALFARGLKALFLGEEVEEDLKGEIVKYLKDLVLFGKEAEEYEFIKEIFGELGEPDPKRARELLNGLGIWRDDEDLELLRSGLQLEFPQEIAKEATRLRRHRPQLNGREDLRDLPVFTVDGPKTRDFDDALSLEIRPDTLRLGIHISDVASIIRPQSPLDSVLMERASSLYLPTKYLPMIPPELSEDGLSLIEGLERPAISLFVDFDREFGILSFRFLPSMIKVEKQLTYDQVDQA